MRSSLLELYGKTPGVPVLRVAHRGVGKHEPENTLRSYRKAIDLGTEMVEVDLRASADGVLVLAHDDEIRDVRGHALPVSGRTFEELRELDMGHGERIPTLEEAVRLCRGRCSMMIDLKGKGFEGELIELLHRTGYRNVIVPGGSRPSRDRIRALAPEIPLSLSLEREQDVTDELFDTLDTDAVTWHSSLLNRERVERLHAREKLVFAWTVDDTGEMERLVFLGVDGIISNRPDLLMRLGTRGA
jgi:glycerophosphoryl diester phosphodiesterase